MSLTLLLPLLVSMLAASLSGAGLRRLQPATASWILATVAVGTALAMVSGLLMVFFSFVHGVPWVGDGLAWCLHLHGAMGPVPWPEATLAAAWAAVATVRVRRCRAGYKALRAAGDQGAAVEIIADEAPVAYSLPGRRGRIVVSSSMLDTLSRREQAVLFAHERSHLGHRHDRFIHATDLAAALVPFLARLRQRVRFATERWADEDAVAVVGDRRLVARALARAALAQVDGPQPDTLSLAGLGVRARVEDLLRESPSRAMAGVALVFTAILMVLSVGGSTIQAHHLAMVADHLCGLT